MHSRFARFALLIALTILSVGGLHIRYRNISQNIAMMPLQLDPAHPGERRLGELIFLKAWELGSGNDDFGGISSLTILPDGRFVGVSDAGTLIGFGLSNDDRTDRPFIAPLPGTEGSEPGSKVGYEFRDSEGMTHNPATGQYWISFESMNAIRRYSPSFARVERVVKPALMKGWSYNSGPEAIVRMTDGRFVVFSEASKGKGETYAAILFSGDPVEPGTVAHAFRYRPPTGYKTTDVTQLPDGRLILLHRKIALPYGLFAAKLAIVDPADIRPGAMVSGHVVATLASPLLVDNMEGIAASKDGDDTIIWLISDNNFNILERTLLMKFRLSEKKAAKKPEAVAAPGFESL